MSFTNWLKCIKSFDARRDLALPGNYDQTIEFCVEYFIEQARVSVIEKGFFTVALSGGSTPKSILKLLSSDQYSKRLEWDKILFFFGDERSVAPDNADSNYKMAMDCALSKLEVPQKNIFRMVVESDAENNAEAYEKLIEEKVPNNQFDLIMLGMGDDGHTASLFPHTSALEVSNRLVVANEVPQKQTLRMTLTYTCINQAHNICFFVLGENKATTLKEVLKGPYLPLEHPSQKIGTNTHKALWIIDQSAATQLEL
ncbi:MAG: 6-phosphogluconolactonase [Chlamydiae bacterium]|nr:6-phosphogluconolactonase [Chlamydiota bacterium]